MKRGWRSPAPSIYSFGYYEETEGVKNSSWSRRPRRHSIPWSLQGLWCLRALSWNNSILSWLTASHIIECLCKIDNPSVLLPNDCDGTFSRDVCIKISTPFSSHLCFENVNSANIPDSQTLEPSMERLRRKVILEITVVISELREVLH